MDFKKVVVTSTPSAFPSSSLQSRLSRLLQVHPCQLCSRLLCLCQCAATALHLQNSSKTLPLLSLLLLPRRQCALCQRHRFSGFPRIPPIKAAPKPFQGFLGKLH